MSEKDVLLVKKENGFCTLEINRQEKLNSMTEEVYFLITQALRSVNEDEQVRVVVLRGAGEKAFSTGHDISTLLVSEELKSKDHLEEVITSISTCRVPVIAMIYGYCLAAACGIAASCDLRLAADNARLGVTAAKIGSIYPITALRSLINTIGVSSAKELLYTGRIIDAEKARQIGLVDQVVPAADLGRVTYELAEEIAHNSPISVRGTKKLISGLLSYQTISPQTREEFLYLQNLAADSQDLKEGRLAFKEKRKPHFKGK